MNTHPFAGKNAFRINLPSSILIGIFWRFGSVLLNLPVTVIVWLKEVMDSSILLNIIGKSICISGF